MAEPPDLEALPHPVFLRRLVARSLIIWFILRSVAAMGASALGSAGLEGAGMEGRGTAGAVLDMSVWARITIMGLVAFLCELSARRRRELVFLGNLGISRRTWLAWALLTPLLMEAVVAVIAVTR